jgi:hypothetical protein
MTRAEICAATARGEYTEAEWPPVIKCGTCEHWTDATTTCAMGHGDPGCGGWEYEERAAPAAKGE